ncbi:MAG TPA: topoisomerase DNA-binding C4 zinc finger domain-containing protein, partial [Limnochordia bacterium]|nr:topoisomerase DNA-binding C4 zinc finger domain-containing protein [Limnochordia bacterium]
ELGIGRPSTYVAIIDTLRKRGYATMEERRFVPTELGKIVVSLLKEHFPQIVDVEFTAGLEERLDSIEEGEADWVEVLRRFYEPFSQALEQAQVEIDAVQIEDEPTDELCEKCNRNMVIKWGRYGKFLACPGFPECKNTKPLLTDIGVACPSCSGRLVERRTRRGRVFYGCERYPECDFTSWKRPVNARCPRCGKLMVERRRRGGQEEWLCSDDACGYAQPAAASEELSGSRI